MMKVLLTRTSEDNERMARFFSSFNLKPVLLPIHERCDLVCETLQDNFSFSIFTSANGVRALDENSHAILSKLPAFAVGSTTAQALQENSYKKIRIGAGTAAQLANEIIQKRDDLAPLCGIYPCSIIRSFDFEAALKPAGISIKIWPVYKFRDVEIDDKDLNQALIATQNGYLPIFSTESGNRFVKLVNQANQTGLLATLTVVGISQNAVSGLRNAGFKGVYWARSPNVEEMAKLIVKLENNPQPSQRI